MDKKYILHAPKLNTWTPQNLGTVYPQPNAEAPM